MKEILISVLFVLLLSGCSIKLFDETVDSRDIIKLGFNEEEVHPYEIDSKIVSGTRFEILAGRHSIDAGLTWRDYTGGRYFIFSKNGIRCSFEAKKNYKYFDLLPKFQTSSPKNYAAIWHCSILAS